MITCHKCGRTWDDTATLCRRCNTPLQSGVNRPGLLTRLRDWLSRSVKVQVTTTVTTQTSARDAEGAGESAGASDAQAPLDSLPLQARETVVRAMQNAGGHAAVSINVTRTAGPIKVVDSREVRTYASLDEMPPALRAKFEQAMKSLPVTPTLSTRITVTLNGEKRTYNSLDEVPPDLRPLVENARRPAE